MAVTQEAEREKTFLERLESSELTPVFRLNNSSVCQIYEANNCQFVYVSHKRIIKS